MVAPDEKWKKEERKEGRGVRKEREKEKRGEK
jgi:hypothetical protein